MSVRVSPESKPAARFIQLACDGDDCKKRFPNHAVIATAQFLRRWAGRDGWMSAGFDREPAEDYCPRCVVKLAERSA